MNAKIYMHGELAWNDFKVMICRSTTPDFVKMITKIQDFFAQQHRNSMRALSSLHTPSLGAGSIMSQLSAPITSHSLKKGKAAEKDGENIKYVIIIITIIIYNNDKNSNEQKCISYVTAYNYTYKLKYINYSI